MAFSYSQCSSYIFDVRGGVDAMGSAKCEPTRMGVWAFKVGFRIKVSLKKGNKHETLGGVLTPPPKG